MNDEYGVRVTDDPDIEARLRELADELDSDELADYAHSTGLYPPGYGPTMDPPIVLVWLPGMSPEDDGIIMWDTVPDQD